MPPATLFVPGVHQRLGRATAASSPGVGSADRQIDGNYNNCNKNARRVRFARSRQQPSMHPQLMPMCALLESSSDGRIHEVVGLCRPHSRATKAAVLHKVVKPRCDSPCEAHRTHQTRGEIGGGRACAKRRSALTMSTMASLDLRARRSKTGATATHLAPTVGLLASMPPGTALPPAIVGLPGTERASARLAT